MPRMNSNLLVPVALALAALVSCDREEPASAPAASASPNAGSPTAPASAAQPTAPSPTGDSAASDRAPEVEVLTIIGVDIDTKLAVMCGIPDSKVFFKHDAAKLSDDAKERLRQISECVTTGAAKDRELLIVGRTDPRGTDEYNKELGMSRADSVQNYLKEQGVAKSRVETESKGEAAAGADPYGWPYDRRVTIRLQDPAS